jgi:phage terminase small subunit
MARGRRGDPPGLQQAKGNPGRRKSKVQKAVEQAEMAAASLSAVSIDGEELPTPEFLNDGRLAVALRIWREVGPELKRTSRLAGHHRLLFAMFCIYTAEWLAATQDIIANGSIQAVATVATGGKGRMERIRPIVHFREIAYRNAIDLGHHFGLTPREEYALFRDQADAFARNPGLFGQRQAPADGEPAADQAPQADTGFSGFLETLDSAPPGQLPN